MKEFEFSEEQKDKNAQLMLDLATSNFSDEEERKSFLVAKAQALSTVASIAFTGFSVLLTNDSNFFGLNAFPLILCVISIILGLYVLISQKYEWVAHAQIITDKELDQLPWAFKMRVAKTYLSAVNKSKKPLDCAIRIFDIAVYVLIGAFISGALSLICFKGGNMSGENKTNTEGKPAAPAEAPSSNTVNTTPYNTELVKKSYPETGSFSKTTVRNGNEKNDKKIQQTK